VRLRYFDEVDNYSCTVDAVFLTSRRGKHSLLNLVTNKKVPGNEKCVEVLRQKNWTDAVGEEVEALRVAAPLLSEEKESMAERQASLALRAPQRFDPPW